jgi:flagellar basal-body rod protein FlgC
MRVENGMFGAIDIALSGMKAQTKQMEAIASNVANARTTDAGDGQPYRRVEAILKASEDGMSGVEIEEMARDSSEFEMIYDPGHPKANTEGYVTMPNVKLPMEMMNMTLASRTYQANTAILKRYQEIVNTALELLR